MDATSVKILNKDGRRKKVCVHWSVRSFSAVALLTARVMTFQVWATEDSFGRDRKTPGS